MSLGDLRAYGQGLRDAPAYTDQVLRVAMTEATRRLQNEWQENLHEHSASGITRRSIQVDVASTPAGVLGVVGSIQPSALFVELGTRPHRIGREGREALGAWAVARLGVTKEEAARVAFAIAHKIAHEGTPARHPMARAASATEGEILAIFERGAAKVAAYLAGGSA